MPKIDVSLPTVMKQRVGDLTTAQTQELATYCLDQLPLEERIQAVMEAFPMDSVDRFELLSFLND